METIILPGFSVKNRDWAVNTGEKMKAEGTVRVIEWQHWQTGQAESGWIDKEAEKIAGSITSPVNLIAKSIGTMVAMKIVKQKPEMIHKIILCGIPLNDLGAEDERDFESLRSFPFEMIRCLQNQDDPHGSFSQAKDFVHRVNPKIKIISQPRADHEYPYPEEFGKFLKNQT